MEGDGSVPSSTATPTPMKSMMTSTSPSIGTITTSTPVEGGSETANTAEEGKNPKTDLDAGGVGAAVSTVPVGNSKSAKGTEAEDKDDKDETTSGGSGMPLVREQLHPLQNPVILAYLVERCPTKLLAKFRLVSKQWWELSLTRWRDTIPITVHHPPLHPDPEHADADSDAEADAPATLEEYVEFMDNPENKCGTSPHRRMKLVSWNNDLNKEAIQSFWNIVGRDLTSLELNKCEFPQVDDLRRTIFGSCPNLKSLSLRNCKFLKLARHKNFRKLTYTEPPFGEQTNLRVLSLEMPENFWEDDRLPIHWLELLSHFPFLTSLKVSLNWRFPRKTQAAHEELFKAIDIIRTRDARKLCLQSFDLKPSLKFLDDLGPNPDLVHFEELQLPLQFLEIELRSSLEPGNAALEDFLNRHRNTLLRITVSRDGSPGSSVSRYPSWFPCNVLLEKLEELRSHMLFTTMAFLKDTPKLQKLEFLESSDRYYKKQEETRIFPEPDAAGMVGVKLLHLTEFRMDYRVTPEDVTSFARMMPNVRKLTMSLNDPLFAIVCRYWKDLKELTVVGEDLTDKGVTGLAEDGGRVASADITGLQGLESFKFWSQEVTDQSVFQGFLKLPSLKVLEVEDVDVPLGEVARKALEDKNIDYKEHYYYDWENDMNGGNGDCEDWVGGSD